MKLNLGFAAETINDSIRVFEDDVSELDLKLTCIRLIILASNLLGVIEGLTGQETQLEDRK